MLDLLSDFLDTDTSVEEKDYLMHADRVLRRAEIDYEHILEEILLERDNMDSGAAVAEVVAVYRRGLRYLFDLHAIKVVDDLSIKQMAEIMTGLLDIDNVENPQQLFMIADEEARPTEKLATMLSQVTTLHTDELMQMIEEVPDAFFARLKDSNHAELHEDENELVERRERIHAYRKFDIYLQAMGAVIAHVPAMLQGGTNPGMTFELYAKMIDGMQPILSMPGKQIARELFAAALISSDGYANPGEIVKANLEQFVPDLKLISEAMVEVRQLMMGYSK